MLEIPWGVTSEDRLDVKRGRAGPRRGPRRAGGRQRADPRVPGRAGVAGRTRPRARQRAGRRRHPGACRPPGVGKTSLGESVARALGRKFVRVSLGGVHDEAEVRGHRRTYVGAQPGRLARALREAGTMNPVIVLDEVDKVGSDYRGDPSSALLEVLDPAQNHTFRDHYLEVELDLSKVLFIATANVTETVPGPLLDRMEVIRIDGYTEEENAGHRPQPPAAPAIGADRSAARRGRDHRRGPGRRVGRLHPGGRRALLERELGRLLRKVATKLAAGSAQAPVVVDADDVRTWLGRPRFFFEAADRTSVPGVATGLAVTGAGGDVLFIEATAMDGRGRPDPDGPIGRRHEGVGRDRALARARACQGARHRRGRLQGQAVPRARPGRGRPQGRPFGRRDDGVGARQLAPGPSRAARWWG